MKQQYKSEKDAMEVAVLQVLPVYSRSVDWDGLVSCMKTIAKGYPGVPSIPTNT